PEGAGGGARRRPARPLRPALLRSARARGPVRDRHRAGGAHPGRGEGDRRGGDPRRAARGDAARAGPAPPARAARAGRAFDRTVEVWDVRPGSSDVLLGRASLFRLEAIAAVGESEMTLGAARGERLRVEIVDGDSAPLDGLAFAAVVRQPSLVFSLATGGG